jgi:hypothetical protein
LTIEYESTCKEYKIAKEHESAALEKLHEYMNESQLNQSQLQNNYDKLNIKSKQMEIEIERLDNIKKSLEVTIDKNIADTAIIHENMLNQTIELEKVQHSLNQSQQEASLLQSKIDERLLKETSHHSLHPHHVRRDPIEVIVELQQSKDILTNENNCLRQRCIKQINMNNNRITTIKSIYKALSKCTEGEEDLNDTRTRLRSYDLIVDDGVYENDNIGSRSSSPSSSSSPRAMRASFRLAHNQHSYGISTPAPLTTNISGGGKSSIFNAQELETNVNVDDSNVRAELNEILNEADSTDDSMEVSLQQIVMKLDNLMESFLSSSNLIHQLVNSVESDYERTVQKSDGDPTSYTNRETISYDIDGSTEKVQDNNNYDNNIDYNIFEEGIKSKSKRRSSRSSISRSPVKQHQAQSLKELQHHIIHVTSIYRQLSGIMNVCSDRCNQYQIVYNNYLKENELIQKDKDLYISSINEQLVQSQMNCDELKAKLNIYELEKARDDRHKAQLRHIHGIGHDGKSGYNSNSNSTSNHQNFQMYSASAMHSSLSSSQLSLPEQRVPLTLAPPPKFFSIQVPSPLLNQSSYNVPTMGLDNKNISEPPPPPPPTSSVSASEPLRESQEQISKSKSKSKSQIYSSTSISTSTNKSIYIKKKINNDDNNKKDKSVDISSNDGDGNILTRSLSTNRNRAARDTIRNSRMSMSTLGSDSNSLSVTTPVLRTSALKGTGTAPKGRTFTSSGSGSRLGSGSIVNTQNPGTSHTSRVSTRNDKIEDSSSHRVVVGRRRRTTSRFDV